MKADTQPALLKYFLQDDIFLLKADKAAYSQPEPVTPAPQITIEPEAKAPEYAAVEETPVITFKYLGGNQKNFLVLTHYPSAEFIADEHLTPLTSTLSRINFTQDDIAIVNMASLTNMTWEQLVDFFKPAKLLVLGAKALPSGIPALQLHQMQQLATGPALYTFSFEEMMTNNENKKTFWNQVKTF